MGGAVFVAKGGSLTVNGSGTASGGTVQGGTGANAGAAFGSGFFVQGSALTFGSGTYTITGDIADQDGSGGAAVSDGLGGTGGATSIAKTGAGTLTLNGTNTYSGGTTITNGTVVGSAKSFGSGSITNDAALVLNQATTATLTNTISGLGSLTKLGTGTLTLSGVNTYSGGTSVLTGTLEIQNAAALGTGGVTLNGGQLRSTIAGTATLPNPLSVSNVGVLTVAPGQTLNIDLASVADGATVLLGSASDTGTLVTTGAAIATAGSSIVEVNGGTVRAGSAQLPGLVGSASKLTLARNATLDLAGYGASIRDLYGAGTLTGNGGTLQILAGDFDGRLTGAVGLDKVSAEPLNLDGVSSYTGPTTVRAGYLGVNGSLASAVSVLNGAALGGSGMIGGLAVQSGGTVAPGNSIGTLSVNGNVSFAPGSVYAVEINAAGQSDRLAATGT
ncbi:autotransporter-associated beta strand repeat-containing protein, partial [Microvirga sp. WGZ8]|nr:autotransporter-associated beta strand repeat-containing protein [Microvirga puerhi]